MSICVYQNIQQVCAEHMDESLSFLVHILNVEQVEGTSLSMLDSYSLVPLC